LFLELPKRGSEELLRLDSALYYALGTYVLLFGIVLLHEFGHCYGARRVGGEADEILLWPLGGLAATNPPHHPRAHFITTVSGPLVNVVICVVAGAAIMLWSGAAAVPWNPLHPLTPVDALVLDSATTGQLWLIRVFGLSYMLLLFNLLPIFPFDGGRILQACLWRRTDYASSMIVATGIGMAGAIVIGVVGLFHEESWLLLMIAVFGYITCWQSRRAVREHGEYGFGDFDYDTSASRLNADQPRSHVRRAGLVQRFRAKRAAARAEHERQMLADRQQLVEEVLIKVSRHGLGSLSARERRVLEEETQRRRELSGKTEELGE
jgi:stage IV sporulation protein FB